MAKQKYGWKKQAVDKRDLRMTILEAVVPATADLRASCPPIYDQGQYGSCTANAACAAFQFDQDKQGLADFEPSRMFEYYNTRVLDGDVDQDGGGTIRNANKALAQNGVCSEAVWPYTDADLLTKPSAAAYADAAPEKISNYASVSQDLSSIQAAIYSGFPVQIGFTVYESFESDEAASTGIIPMPDTTNEQVLGGHAILLVGYADKLTVSGQVLENIFIFRNSWGTSWGDQGYGYIPQAYMLDPNQASDLWVVNAVPGGSPSPAPTPTPSPSPTPDPGPTPSPTCDPEALFAELLACLGLSRSHVAAKIAHHELFKHHNH